MENCPGDRRCLICRRVSKENSLTYSEKLVSNASLLQDFLDCFHINVLDSQVIDRSKSCQFCPTCEQFIAEWSSIQTQMTQLTRRASELKATLSALVLSTPEIHPQIHDEHIAGIINNRIHDLQEDQLPLLLQQTVDGLRDELQKKYSVRVMLEKIPRPLEVNLDALPVSYDDVDEPSGHGEFVADDFELKNFPKEEKMDDEVKPELFDEMKIKKEEANRDDSNPKDSVDSKEINVQAGKMKTKAGPSKPYHNDSELNVVPDEPEAVPFISDGKRECPHCQKRYQDKSFLKHVRSCPRISAKKKPIYRCCLCKKPYETRKAKNACEDGHLILCSCGEKIKYTTKRRRTHKDHKGYKPC